MRLIIVPVANRPECRVALNAALGLAAVLGVCAWWALNATRWGKLLQAVIHDREMAAAFGINVSKTFTVTFIIGAMLGALGGAVTAPMISVVPGIGVEVLCGSDIDEYRALRCADEPGELVDGNGV